MSEPRLAVVIPAGPADNVADTLESVLHFTAAPRLVVLVDDTSGQLTRSLHPLPADVAVIPAPPRAHGAHGGLWVKLAAGYRYVMDRFPFDVLLRLDADALVIGHGIAEIAAARFAADPGVGMLGSYRIGPDGAARSFDGPARSLAREHGLLGLRRPGTRAALRSLYRAATATGYVPGEHALGGAYLHSAAAVQAMARRGFLDLPALARSGLGEDHLFSLVTMAAGFRIGDLGGPNDPLALRWRGLPAAPEDLLARRKVVTHSVRFWGELGEESIREIFAAARHGSASVGPGASSV